MPRLHLVKKAQKDYPAANIKKGESYWWWQFAYSSKTMSKTKPERWQLTQSGFLSQLWEAEDSFYNNVNAAETKEDLESAVESFKETLETLRDECQEKLDNMPDHLQDSSNSGVLLSERIEACDAAIDALESVSLDEIDGAGADDKFVSELQSCKDELTAISIDI